MGKVFISYASSDKSTAKKLCEYLEEHSLKCWIAPRDVTAGNDYAGDITRAVRNADSMVVILSDTSVNSPHVLNEVSLGFSNRITIVPYCLGNAHASDSLAYYLAAKHYVRSSNDDIYDFDCILKALVPYAGCNDFSEKKNTKKWLWFLLAIAAIAIAVLATLLLTRQPKVEPTETTQTTDNMTYELPEEESEVIEWQDEVTQAETPKEPVLTVSSASSTTSSASSPQASKAETNAALAREDAFKDFLNSAPKHQQIDPAALSQEGDNLFALDRGKYISDNVRSRVFFHLNGDAYEPLIDATKPSESLQTLLCSPEAGKAFTMHIIQHKYGFKTETFDRNLASVISSLIDAGCKPFVGIDSNDGSTVTASLFMVNGKDGYVHTFRVKAPISALEAGKGTFTADLNAYSPLTESESMFHD